MLLAREQVEGWNDRRVKEEGIELGLRLAETLDGRNNIDDRGNIQPCQMGIISESTRSYRSTDHG